mmetsp:Transcript_14253/g.53963  ORF Transcript_14253/g.53963 Transcript_14253/m.53963 type:complete len:226 (-) Transcript_14253:53-730(-)
MRSTPTPPGGFPAPTGGAPEKLGASTWQRTSSGTLEAAFSTYRSSASARLSGPRRASRNATLTRDGFSAPAAMAAAPGSAAAGRTASLSTRMSLPRTRHIPRKFQNATRRNPRRRRWDGSLEPAEASAAALRSRLAWRWASTEALAGSPAGGGAAWLGAAVAPLCDEPAWPPTACDAAATGRFGGAAATAAHAPGAGGLLWPCCCFCCCCCWSFLPRCLAADRRA